ncbi:DUF1273 domain-containing protein [Paenibacillus macerans]|uniref:DUF1273 domain-containing protein n=1 Tax=Paenibacillus macerans TaxID=44252 RepID=UPI003D318170
MKNILVTGYRAHELGIYSNKHQGIPYIRQAIEGRLVPLLEEGLEWVITPGQYGVDLWACEAVFELKKRYPQLKCSIITAYSHQEEKWSDEKKSYYEQILRQVDHYAAASKEGYIGRWQFTARDELLFRKTDGLLLVYDEDAGEASPKFFKERALKKQAETGYIYLNIGSEEIQAIANDDQELAYADSDYRPDEPDPA